MVNLRNEWRQWRVDVRMLANLAPRMRVLLVDVIDDFRQTHLRQTDGEGADVVAGNVENPRHQLPD